MKGDASPVVLLVFKQGEYMAAGLSGIEHSQALNSDVHAAELANNPSFGGAAGRPLGISEAGAAIWNRLSADLKQNPSLHWQNALDTANELARSVCGQDLPEDLQSDLIGNFNLLEQTLLGLKIQSTDELASPHSHIRDLLSVLKLNVVASSKQLQTLHSLKNNSSN